MVTLLLDGPRKNALSTTMMRFVRSELEKAGGQPVLLSGSGDAFCAGLDLQEVASLDDAGMHEFLGLLQDMLDALYTYPAPIVARVNGHAIAGGCVVAMACDWRVADRASRLKMGLNEVALGLHYPPRILELVKRRIDRRHLEEVVLGAGLHDVASALRLGLLDELVEDSTAVAEARLSALAAHPSTAYAAAKRSVRGTLSVSDGQEREFLNEVLPTWTSPELKMRVAKVLAR